jgi:hypothetical protein
MKVWRVSLCFYPDGVDASLVEGDAVTVNGMEWVQIGKTLTERTDEWQESRVGAIAVAIPRVAKLHATVEQLISHMHEGRLA